MTRRKPLGAIAATAVTWAAAASFAFGQVASAPIPLDGPAAETAQPSIALAPDGRVGCAWVSREASRQSIVLRERIGGVWTAPAVFAEEPAGRPSSPVLLYDKGSNPRLIWRDGPPDRGFIAYAYRHSGLWVRYGPISEGAGGGDDPSAAFDSQGSLNVAWREGSGSFWRIVAARFEPDGALRRWNLTAGRPERLNLYPTVLGVPQAVVLWFAEGDSSLELDGRRYDAESGQWVPEPLTDLADLPANRLPYLFALRSDLVFGVWFDALDGIDRVFLGLGGPLARGAGIVADDNPAGPNSQPYGTLTPQGYPVICWRGETARGPALFVRKRSATDWLPSAVLSVPEPPYPARPRVAAEDKVAHVVWSSESADGGTGNIYYSAVQWNGE